MKRTAAMLALVCLFSFSIFAAEKPVRGKTFTVSYDPSSAGMLNDAGAITLVYAFDAWGTSAVQKMKGEPGSNTDLFQNVLHPDPGAEMKVPMERQGRFWKTTINIPQEAHLLSWYVTDGTKSDDNHRRTYVSYIYTEKGVPVRDARFQNVDFLLMAGKGDADILKELKGETTAYPDNFLAHMVFWRFKFFTTASADTMERLLKESEKYFAKLHRQFGDTVLNYQVRALYEVNRVIALSMRERWDTPDVAALRKHVNTRILALIGTIPASKRTARVDQVKEGAEMMLMSKEELTQKQTQAQKEAAEMMSEFVGKSAPDFPFTTLDGVSHRLSEFRGTYVLLDFWGTWCGPCVSEIPNLVKMYGKYASKGLTVLSISSDAMMKRADKPKLIEFTREKGMTWMQVLDEASGDIHKQYHIRFWPNVFLIDPDGVIVQRDKLRGDELEKTLSMLPLK